MCRSIKDTKAVVTLNCEILAVPMESYEALTGINPQTTAEVAVASLGLLGEYSSGIKLHNNCYTYHLQKRGERSEISSKLKTFHKN